MKGFLRAVAAIALAGAAAWCAAALNWGPSPSAVLAIGMLALGLAAGVSVFAAGLRKPVLPVFALALVAFAAWWSTVTPSNARDWAPEVAVLSYATIDGDVVTVHNVRNFQYRTETDFTPRYYDKTVRLSELESADLITSYWMGDAIAHVMVSFGFRGGEQIAVSIETRKERSESYSTIEGFFRRYEIFYVVADERDLIGLRTNHRRDPPEQVYLYRIDAPPENLRRIFLDYLREINELAEQPKFYNTMTTNCTTSILMHSRMNPGDHSFSWKILLSGYAPQYVYERGRLDQRLPFEELKRRSLINAAAQAAGDDAPDFSRRIRKGLPDPRDASGAGAD